MGYQYYLKRIGQAVLTLIVVTTLVFAMYRLLPGNPVDRITSELIQQAQEQGRAVNEEEIRRRVKAATNIDPDQPIHIAYYEYIRDALTGDFGISVYHREPVFQLLFKAMPWSVFISVYGLLLGFTSNVILGAIMAYKENSLFDKSFTGVAIVLTSTPYYVGAILMLSFLAFDLGWFPTGGRFNPETTRGFNWPFMIGVLHHGALPIISGFIVGFGGGALSMRGNSVRVMGEDYLRVARVRGIPSARIATRYVARNAILPLYTGLMIGIAGIFSSSIILERIFTYVGVGWYTFDALLQRDYPLLMGSFIFYTTITITGILIADLTYGLVDPRAETSEREAY